MPAQETERNSLTRRDFGIWNRSESRIERASEATALATPAGGGENSENTWLGYIEPGKCEGMTEDERHPTFEML